MQVNRYRLPKKESEKEVKTEEEVKSVQQPMMNITLKKEGEQDDALRGTNVSNIDFAHNDSEQLLDEEDMGELGCYSNRPKTSNIQSHSQVHYKGRLTHNQTSEGQPGRQAVACKRQLTEKGMGRKVQLTQALIDKRRKMNKGSRFPYAFDMMAHDFKQMGSETVYSNEELVYQTNVTPAAHSGIMTRTSTHYNHDSKNQIANEGFTCFGNPTLETMKL